MNVNKFASQQNLISRYNNQVSFGNNTRNTTTKPDSDSKGDSFINKHKKEIVIGSAVAGVTALIVTTVAYARGKIVNIANNKESKFLSNISEGFKSFFGKGKEAYKAIINKKNNNPTISPKTENIGGSINVNETDVAQTTGSRINRIITQNDLSNHNIVGNIDNAVKDGLLSLDDEMACAISDDVMINLLTANGHGYYCDGINFNILNNLKNIRTVYSPEQVKTLCADSPDVIINAIQKAPEEFAKLAIK